MVRNKCTNTKSRNSEENSDLQPNTLTATRRLVSTYRPYFTHTDTFRPLTRPRGHKLPVTTNLEDCKLPTPSSSSSSTTPLFYLHNEIVLSHSLPPSLPDLKTAQTLSSPSCSSAILPSFLQSRAAEDRQITDRRRTHPTRPDRPCHIPGSRKKRIS